MENSMKWKEKKAKNRDQGNVEGEGDEKTEKE